MLDVLGTSSPLYPVVAHHAGHPFEGPGLSGFSLSLRFSPRPYNLRTSSSWPTDTLRDPSSMRIVIIGAGPSGLVTLKYAITAHTALQTDPIDVMLFESEAGVGGTFYARTYEDAEVRRDMTLDTLSPK